MIRFIFSSILKTFLFSNIISSCLMFFYLMVNKNQNLTRQDDMSGLPYVLIVFWILLFSLIASLSFLTVIKSFQKTFLKLICWFLLPFSNIIWVFFILFEGAFDKEIIMILMISCLPWFSIWGFYYYQFNKKLVRNESF